MELSVEPTNLRLNDTKVGWIEEPNQRGTLSLLITCLSSLFLSSWAVMNLNIPRKNASASRQTATYLYWCLYGIFGPELVIWTAWRQLLSAWALRDELRKEVREIDRMEKMLDANADSSKLPEKPWTISHGFYTLMGGFVFDLDEPSASGKPTFTNGIRRLSATPKGLLLLAKCGCLPEISKEEILDKSKVDDLGKLLACTQVTWMVVQVCTRLAVSLPVTALEVTAVSHVTCALVLYALWWHKPRKIEQPTMLAGDWVRPLVAFMLMCSRESQGQILPQFQLQGEDSEMAGLKVVPSRGQGHSNSADFRFDFVRKEAEPSPQQPRKAPGTPGRGSLVISTDANNLAVFRNVPLGLYSPLGDGEDDSSSATAVRWALANIAIETYPAVRRMLRRPSSEKSSKFELALAAYPEMPLKCRRYVCPEVADSKDEPWLECTTQHLVSTVASNWPHDGLLRTTSGLWIGASLWLVSIIFSGIHIAAWHAAFPSVIEAWLWRCASVYVACAGLLWAITHVMAHFSARLWWTWYDIMMGDAPRWLVVVMSVVCGVCGFAYVFSRAYLVIEAFTSLRLLPVAAYIVPDWTMGVPHIG